MGSSEVVYCTLCMVLCTTSAKFITYVHNPYGLYIHMLGLCIFMSEVSKRTNNFVESYLIVLWNTVCQGELSHQFFADLACIIENILILAYMEIDEYLDFLGVFHKKEKKIVCCKLISRNIF